MDTDFLLIQKMRAGDEQAIEAFIKKYYPAIIKYCRVHISDYGYAEDTAQETFLRFFRTLSSYQHYGKAANYLYAIASNACRDHYKRKQEIPVEAIPEPESGMQDATERVDIQRAFARLPDELYETAVLYFLQERKQKDIARILGIGLSLVKYRVRRARALLAAYFLDDPGHSR